MKISRTLRLPLLAVATLGILAACDVSDSPARTDAPTTGTFAPRILAPAGGVRQADWLHVQVWSRDNLTGVWSTVFKDTSVAPNRTSLQVQVPLQVKLRYRIAGYAITFPHGIRQVDTVWSAFESEIPAIYDQTPVSRPAGTVARNWAVAPTIPYSESVEFLPGNELVIPAPPGQRLAVSRTSDSVSCTNALPRDSSLRIRPLVETTLRVWVRTCSDDSEVLPSYVRSYQWAVDTLGLGAQKTPLAPVASGLSGFADFGRILLLESDPTQPLSFSIPTNAVLAWNLEISPDTLAPEVADFPAAPATADSADASSTGTSMDLWTDSLEAAVARSSSGLRVAVSLVRIDTSLGKSWVSPPTRFWFRLSPPAAPLRFDLTATRWDSVRVDWDLVGSGLTYRAWQAPGSSPVDTSRATEIPVDADSTSLHLGGLSPNSDVSLLLEIRDPRSGLARWEQRNARTLPLPELPIPFPVTPNTFGASIKVGALATVKVGSLADAAGRMVSFLWTFSTFAKSGTTRPDTLPWPEIPASGATSSPDGSISPSASPGDYVLLTVVTEDPEGRRSGPLNHLLEVVADDVEVPPDAPSQLRIKARTESSITFAWTNTPGTKALLRYNVNRLGETIPSETTTDTTHTITDLKAGDSVVEVAVKAVQLASPFLQSAYSQPSLNTRTRIPPVDLGRPVARWIEGTTGLRLRISWVHVAGQEDQIGWGGVASPSTAPGSVQWKPLSVGQSGPDSLEIPYVNLPPTPWLAIGLRAIRDSIAGLPVWTPVRIPALAPDIADLSPRIWQRGDSLWISLGQASVDTASFVLNARASQGTIVRTFELTGKLGSASLAGFAAGKLSGELWWSRLNVEGVRAFDSGAVLRVEKNLLPAPSSSTFSLVPGDSITDWILQSSSGGLLTGATPVLVMRSGRDGKVAYVGATTVQSNPADRDTFQLVQVLEEDTSLATEPRTILLSTAIPAPSVPQGAYLFPFPISLTGNGGAVQVATTAGWQAYKGLFDPFAVGSFKTRLWGPFLASPPRTLTYTQDSTFNDKVWGKRVDAAMTPGGTDPLLLVPTNATITYTPQDLTARLPAIINIKQVKVEADAILSFLVDPIDRSTLDLSLDSAIAIGTYKAYIAPSFGISVRVASPELGEIDIWIPTTFKNDRLLATFSGTTSLLPSYFSPTKNAVVPIPWSDLPKLLTRVKSVSVTAKGDGRSSLVEMPITGLRVVPKGAKF